MIIAGSWRRGRWRGVGAACVDLLAFECAQHAQEFGTIFTPSRAFLPHWWPGRQGARGIQSTIFTPSLEQTLLHVFCSSLAGQLGTRFQNQIGSFVFFYPIRPRASSMVDVVCGLSASPRTRFQTQIGSFVFFNPIRPRASSIVDVGCGLGAGPRTRFRNQRLREPLGSTAISSETSGTPHPLNPRTSP
jgi:hypothetical protein